MKLKIVSLEIKTPQKFKDENFKWKTLPKGSITFLEVGYIQHDGVKCLVGFDSSKITDTSKVKRNISDIENMDTESIIRWFKDNYHNIKPIYIAEENISAIGKSNEKGKNVSITGSFELNWDDK